MNIKSLLLGSAAALVAVTGARAADVIYVEPEPVEYVRVCDVYGTGFYYIPGTETCIRLSGYVRMQINAAGSPAENLEGDDYQVSTQVRTRLNFDIREETELGLLRAYARIQGTNAVSGVSGASSNANYIMDQAYVQLGGLLLGHRDSLWSSDVGGLGDGLLTDTDLTLGDFKTNQINYTFAAGGFSAVIGVEDDGTGDAVPDVHGKLVYSGAWGGAYLSAVYDETVNVNSEVPGFGGSVANPNFDPLLPVSATNLPFIFSGNAVGFTGIPALGVDGNNDAFALKAGVELSDLLVAGSTLKVEGSYAFDPTVYSTIGLIGNAFAVSSTSGTIGNPTPGEATLFVEWAIGAGYSQQVGAFNVAIAGQYGELFDQTYLTGFNPVTGAVATATAGGDYYSIVGNVGYDITSNFGALAEIQYTDVNLDALGSVDQTRGFLRFVRSF